MRIEDNSLQFMAEVREEVAKRMAVAAVTFQTNLKTQLSTSYPPASVPGEYPHGRTWFGRNNLIVTPTAPTEIASGGKVAVGFRKPAFYMVYLETDLDRKGILSLFESMQQQLGQILGGGATASAT